MKEKVGKENFHPLPRSFWRRRLNFLAKAFFKKAGKFLPPAGAPYFFVNKKVRKENFQPLPRSFWRRRLNFLAKAFFKKAGKFLRPQTHNHSSPQAPP